MGLTAGVALFHAFTSNDQLARIDTALADVDPDCVATTGDMCDCCNGEYECEIVWCASAAYDPCTTDSCRPECACNCSNPVDSCVCETGDPAMCGASSSYNPPPPPSSNPPSSYTPPPPSSGGASSPC